MVLTYASIDFGDDDEDQSPLMQQSTSYKHLMAWTIVVCVYELFLTSEHLIEGNYIGKFRFTVRSISRYFLWLTVPMAAFSLSFWFLYTEPCTPFGTGATSTTSAPNATNTTANV